MINGEAIPNNSSETKQTARNDGPWGEDYQKSIPPFGGSETQAAASSNAESDDYIVEEDGIEYRNINKIDISTEQGKYEWLDSLMENGATQVENELKNAEYDGDDRAISEAKIELSSIERQQKILRERIDINSEGGVIGALRRESHSMYNKLQEMISSGRATQDAIDMASEDVYAVNNLLSLVESEAARRDPAYFGPAETSKSLELAIKQAEREVDRTMLDGYVGEDGFVHMAQNGEKLPSTATENAEIALEDARQDAETFNLIMNDYQVANGYNVPRVVKKSDFTPTINNFIDGRTRQINQLLVESKSLTKGTPEYSENEAKRRRLAKERSSAKRLATEML